MLFDFKGVLQNKITSKYLNEYLSYKMTNQDFIVFFQMGQFYETYFEDAKILSDISGIALTSRYFKEVGKIALAGIPVEQIDTHVKKLLSQNKKICICNQVADENGNYCRKIVRKYTKGTIFENEYLDSYENNFILLTRKTKQNNYEIVYADVSTGQFYKTLANEDEFQVEIEKVSPNELLIFESQKKIFKKIINKYNTVLIQDEDENTKIEDVLIKYCKDMQQGYLVSFDNIIEYKPSIYLLMDSVTRRGLELTRTQRYLKKKGSLFWFINKTKTSMGARLLKKYLNEPLIQLDKILERQKAIEELIGEKENLDQLEKILQNFCDLSRLAAKMSNTTITPKDVFQISENSDVILELKEFCTKFKSKKLKINEENCNLISSLTNEIRDSISECVLYDSQWCNIIKDGYNYELDLYRKELKEIYNFLGKYEEKQKSILGSEKVKIDKSKILGYYIEIPTSKQLLAPKNYLKRQNLTHVIRYTTEELREAEEKIYYLSYKIDEISKGLYFELRKKIKLFTNAIRDLAKDIARIDALFSIAKCSYENGFKKPSFNNEKIEIIDGYHPNLLELNIDIIKNNTLLNNGEMIILTGANMSGKSTYLKYNAIISILSQIGSFVPAKNANITIVDKIFFRQGAFDDISNSNSSFMIEMEDLKYILDNATKDSLILLDEPAKSTSEKEGGAITKAFCEYLLKYYSAKTIIVTHNLNLTNLELEFPDRVSNYTVEIDEKSSFYSRKITKGIASNSFALNVAKLANLPLEIVKQAKIYIGFA